MKPEVGGLNGRMAQEEAFDPLDLLSRVAMLVLEARTPHPSVKGRVEGPHCSSAPDQRGQHLCCPQEMPQCAQALEVRQRMDAMCRNGIPSCMDILLFPDCPHGRTEAGSLDGAGNDFEENAVLLERWSIKCVQKWQGEWREGVGGSYLLQAMRSYLYFSQLSSWLASMRGHLPAHIAYRLYAPGDCGDIDFIKPPSSHVFPSAVYGPHGVKVAVLHLPRLDRFPNLRCVLGDPGTFCVGGSAGQQRPAGGEPEEGGGRWKQGRGVVKGRGGDTTPYAKHSGSQQSGTWGPSSPQGPGSTGTGARDSRAYPQDSATCAKKDNNVQPDWDKGKASQDRYARRHDPMGVGDGRSAQQGKGSFRADKSHPHATAVMAGAKEDRRHVHHRKTVQNIKMEKRRTTQDMVRRLVQEGTRPSSSSKRPPQDLPSSSSSSSSLPSSSRIEKVQSHPSKCQQLDLLDAADDGSPDVPRLKVKGEGRGKGKGKKPSTRVSLESQLRPLELTPTTSTQCLDLHSPRVLMSDVFYNPAPLSASQHRMQLDFSLPPTPPPTGGASWQQHQQADDKALLMQRYSSGGGGAGGGGWPGHLLSSLELTNLLYNLHALPGPPLLDKAQWLRGVDTSWDDIWGRVRATSLRRNQGEKTGHAAQLCKKALLFGEDTPSPAPPAPAPVPTPTLRLSPDPSPGRSASELARGPATPPSAWSLAGERAPSPATEDAWSAESELASIPAAVAAVADADSGGKPCQLPAGKARRDSRSCSLKRASPELPTGKVKVKKREGGASAVEDHCSSLAESAQCLGQGVGETSATPPHPHSIPSSSPRSVSHTFKDPSTMVPPVKQCPTVQSVARHKFHPAVDALSNSWSSSSSSSSSTYSSSPKVSTGAADTHSDSSTPTNLSTSPLPEDQQTVPSSATAACPVKPSTSPLPEDQQTVPSSATAACPVKPSVLGHPGPSLETSASFSRHTETATRSGTKPLGQDVAELEACCAPGVCDPDAVSKRLETGSPDSAEGGRLQRGAEGSPLPGCSWWFSLSPDTRQREGYPPQHSCENGSSASSPPSSLHSTASSDPSPFPFAPDTPPGGGRACVRLPLPSAAIELESVARCESTPERARSPCEFCLESFEEDSPAFSLWQRAFDQDGEDDIELTSLLERLCLQQTEAEDSAQRHSQANGCGVDPFTRHPGQANGHVFATAVRNGSQPSDSVANDSLPSLSNQPTTHRERADSLPTGDDLPVVTDEDYGLSSSISESSLVPSHRQQTANQRKTPGTKSVAAQRSVGNGFPPGSDQHSFVTNGASAPNRAEEDAAVDGGSQEDDGVFYDRAGEEVGEGGVVPHCPTRTKSAPTFSCVSTKVIGTGSEEVMMATEEVTRGRPVLREKDGVKLSGCDRVRNRLVKSASQLFNSRGNIPSQSSPAPMKRRSTGRFDYDETLTSTKAIKSAISLSRLPDACKDSDDPMGKSDRVLSTSAPASTNCLLGNFEESILNGRLAPAGVVEGFTIDIGASGKFCPRHVSLPVTAYFFNLSDDNAPSPYLGHINLDSLGRRGYHIPNVGTLQVTLFNPNRTVVKMFVVKYDLQDMPPNSQTVLRQRTVYQPVDPLSTLPSYLRYLIHLRLSSSSSGKTYLHTDIRLIFARHKFELDSSEGQYQLTSYTDTPANPKYSPKRKVAVKPSHLKASATSVNYELTVKRKRLPLLRRRQDWRKRGEAGSGPPHVIM